MNPERLIQIGGAFHLLLALIHIAFWKFLRWKTELPKVSRVNRAVMQVLNIQLTYVFFVVAALSFFFAAEMTQTGIGRTLTICVFGFWLIRIVNQIIFFPMRHWLSILFTLLFLIGATLYGIALLEG